MDDKDRYAVIAKLQTKIPAADIADQLDLSLSAVLRVKAKYKEAVKAGTVDKLLGRDELVLSELVELYPDVAADEVVNGMAGLDMLNESLQSSALMINAKVLALIPEAVTGSELVVLTDIICKLQAGFMNKSVINIQNNTYGEGGGAYSQYLGDKPGATHN